MYKFEASCHLQGDQFLPGKAEGLTDISFYSKQEAWDIADKGPYIGKPYAFGKAVIDVPQEIENQDEYYAGLEWLVETLTNNIQLYRDCGAEDIHIYLFVWYASGNDCNLSLDVDLLNKIANLNIPLCITCRKVNSLDEI